MTRACGDGPRYSGGATTKSEPGLSDSAVRVGVVLAPEEVLPKHYAGVRSLLTQWFAELSDRGGVHDRRIELAFTASAGTAADRAAAFHKLAARSDMFAAVASWTEGAEAELTKVAEELHVPLLATMTANPHTSVAPSPWLRDLYGGLAEQARALARFAVHHLKAAHRIAVVHTEEHGRKAEQAAAELAALGAVDVVLSRGERIDAPVIIFLGDHKMRKSLGPATAGKTVLMPAVVAHPEAVSNDPESSVTWLAFAALPSDLNEQGAATLRRLLAGSERASKPRLTDLAALASASLFVESLQRAGRAASREKLLASIDTIRKYTTGFSPPLTYTPTRHIGSMGAHIVCATPGVAQSAWVELDEVTPGDAVIRGNRRHQV